MLQNYKSIRNHIADNIGKNAIFVVIANLSMRKNLSSLAITLSVIGLSACSNKLNVQAPYKNIAVVYGLMDQSDSAHYIRINKAYEGTGNAYTMAKQYDSIYYPVSQLTVQLQDVNQNGNVVATINLVADSSIPVPAGTFSYPKQILYKTKAALNTNDIYNLIITNTHTHQVLTGSTTLLQDVSFTLGVGGSSFNFNFSNQYPTVIDWTSSASGRIYQMTFRFYYSEKTSSGKSENYIDWVQSPQTSPTLLGGYPMSYNFTGMQFLQLVKTLIPVESGVQRTADSLKMIFTTGSDDFNTYIQLSQPSLGIDQDPPSFSDVTKGIGIFTSRHTQTITKQLNQTLIDSLIYSPQTAPLNFVP
jgi:hypothetical protein